MSDDNPDGPLDLFPLTLSDKPIFDHVFSRLAQPISDYTFANLFVWGSCMPLYWTSLHRHLCVFTTGLGDLSLMLPPIAQAGADSTAGLRRSLEESFAIMDAYNSALGRQNASRIEYVSDEMLEQIQSAVGLDLSLSTTPMSGDFIYPCSNMIHLAGGALKSKRHSRSKFVRDYPQHHVQPYTDQHYEACMSLLQSWHQHADEAHMGQITEDDSHTATALLRQRETFACLSALKHHRELGLTGMVLYVNDEIAGFTLGQALSPAQASILFEKTHPNYYGSAQFIFSEFCRLHWPDFPEINVGDDWGIPSLRITKESYRPSRRLNKYSLARPEPSKTLVSVPAVDPARLERTVVNMRQHFSQFKVVTALAKPSPQLRPAHADDVPQLVEIERKCFNSADAFNPRQIRNLIRNERAVCLVVECDGAVVGWCVALVRQHLRYRSGRIYSLAITPESRGSGFGTLLAKQIIDRLGRLGVRQIYLEVDPENTKAIRLYRSLNFQTVRVLPGYYDLGRDGMSMRLSLPSPEETPLFSQRFFAPCERRAEGTNQIE